MSRKKLISSTPKRLLDMGLRKADVSATLQRKYNLSRATAYRDVDEDDGQSREIEDHKIEADPVPDDHSGGS